MYSIHTFLANTIMANITANQIIDLQENNCAEKDGHFHNNFTKLIIGNETNEEENTNRAEEQQKQRQQQKALIFVNAMEEHKSNVHQRTEDDQQKNRSSAEDDKNVGEVEKSSSSSSSCCSSFSSMTNDRNRKNNIFDQSPPPPLTNSSLSLTENYRKNEDDGAQQSVPQADESKPKVVPAEEFDDEWHQKVAAGAVVEERAPGDVVTEEIKLASASSTEEKKNGTKKSGTFGHDESSSSSLLDPNVSRWLQGLKWRAELETMSVLYAKSVLQTNGAPTVAQRVPLRDRPFSMPKSDHYASADLRAMFATANKSQQQQQHLGINSAAAGSASSPPKMRAKQQQDNKSKQNNNDHQRSHHRSTVCLSSSTVSHSLVMNRQSIVVVPAGEDGTTDGDELTTFNKSCGTTTTSIEGTLTKFALSLPNDASLGERLIAQRRHDWTPPSTARRKLDHGVQQLTSLNTMDYAELPLCDPPTASAGNVYQPRIKYRRNRKGGSSASINASSAASYTLSTQRKKSPFSITDSPPLQSGGLAVRPIAFRHSIRVNEQDEGSELMSAEKHNFSLPPSMSMSLFYTFANKLNCGLVEDDSSPYDEETVGSLDSGQCSGSSPPYINNNCTSVVTACTRRRIPANDQQQQRHSCFDHPYHHYHSDHHHHTDHDQQDVHQRRCSHLDHDQQDVHQRRCSHLDHDQQDDHQRRCSHPDHDQQDVHQRRCSDDAITSSEAGTTVSSVEMMVTKFGGSSSMERRCGGGGSRSSGIINKMPSYARSANCIAQVLRLSSVIFAQLGSALTENRRRYKDTKKLLSNTNAYMRLLSECPCAAQMPQWEMELVRRAMQDAEGEMLLKHENVQQPNDYLCVCVRRMLEQTLLIFVRLISNYLAECANHDQLLLIALEQFVHLLLFGDELCLEAIRHKSMDNLLALALVPLTGSDTLKLLLRTMSVLCGTAKGCIQLLSIGGLDFVLRVLRDSTHADCSIEAAGCLAQLCSPAHCFLRLSSHSLQSLVPRLLTLVDHSPSPEALLLCLAALANMCALCASVTTEVLYTHNAVLRLVKAAGSEHSAGNLFVQEELVTIFTRMANRGFERALVAQGAIPVLCRLLQLEMVEHQSQRQNDFQRRVSYKAAVCLGILASTGSGLKALYDHKVHKMLSKILHSAGPTASGNVRQWSSTHRRMSNASQSMASATAPPIQLICSSISQRLQHTYQLETAV